MFYCHILEMKTSFFIIIFWFCNNLLAQIQQSFGYADASISELSQFEYYRGQWASEMEIKQENGSFRKLENIATVTGIFLEDHKTFQSKFTTPSGFFSTTIQTYDTTRNEWRALFLNANAQRWHHFTSKVIDGKMTSLVIGGYSGKESFDVRGVDEVVSADQYQRNIYYSYDSGESWELMYKMYYSKVPE